MAKADATDDDGDDDDDELDDDGDDSGDDDKAAAKGGDSVAAARKAWLSGDDEAAAKALGLQPQTIKVLNRSPKHVRQMLKKLDAAAAKLNRERDEHGSRRTLEAAEDANRLARANEKFGPIAQAISDYGHGNKGAALIAIEKMFKKPFATIARDLYEESREGATVAELKRDLAAVQAELASRKTGEKEATDKAAKEGAEKKSRETFDKKIKGHGLHSRDEDNELADRAFKLYRESWDEDLDDYAMTPKQAADKVLERETKRSARILGSAPKPRAGETNERPSADPPKARSAMSKEERREADKKAAIARVDAGKRQERRAAL